MAWSGGTFTRTNGTYTGATVWAQDEANNHDIESARFDTHDYDIAQGINACLTKDGTNSPSAHLTWIKSNYWGGTSGGSANVQTISLSPALPAYAAGVKISFICGFSSTGAWTINVNGLGAANVIGIEAIANALVTLVYNGSAFVPVDSCSSLLLDRVTTQTIVTTTTSETTLYSKSIPANIMGTRRALRLTIKGRVGNSTGTSKTARYRVKFGSTTLADTETVLNISSTAFDTPYELTLILQPNNSATAQKAHFTVQSVDTGFGPGITSPPYIRLAYNSASEDTTAAVTLEATVELSASSASLVCVIDYACLELL